jgi:hypothetical protein
MKKIDNGGPAFPVHPDLAGAIGCVNSAIDAGMTLRDYFAAKALQAMVSNATMDGYPYEYANFAYKYADAMLKAREEK